MHYKKLLIEPLICEAQTWQVIGFETNKSQSDRYQGPRLLLFFSLSKTLSFKEEVVGVSFFIQKKGLELGMFIHSQILIFGSE